MLGIYILLSGIADFKQFAIDFSQSLMPNLIETFKNIITAILAFKLPKNIDQGIEDCAVSLTGLFLAMEMITHLASMRMEGRIEDALQLGIKLVVAKIIIENTSAITGGIYDLFSSLGVVSIETGFQKIQYSLPSNMDSFIENNKGLIGEGWILCCIILLIVGVITAALLLMITVQILGIIFEIAIHQTVAPIALSTLCNGTMRSTGLSFIKSYSAVCLQTTVIGAIFTAFGNMSSMLTNGVNGGGFKTAIEGAGFPGMIFMYFTPILMMVIISVTVNKSGEITKRMFGA